MRRINERGLALIREFEGCKLTAYRDIAGILTIGYGSTGSHVKPGMTITQDEADALLLEDVARFERGVERAVAGVPTSDNEFAALTALTFNIGFGDPKRGIPGLLTSTVLKRHRLGNHIGAGNAFLMWNKARVNGKLKTVNGLVRRREAERALYLMPDELSQLETVVKAQTPPEKPVEAPPSPKPVEPAPTPAPVEPAPLGCLAAVLGMFR